MWVNNVGEMYSNQWILWSEKYSKCSYRCGEGIYDKFKPVVRRHHTFCVIDKLNDHISMPCPPNVNRLKSTSVTMKRGYYISHGYRNVLTMENSTKEKYP